MSEIQINPVRSKARKPKGSVIAGSVAVALVIVILFVVTFCTGTVENGHIGLLNTMGRVSEHILQPGFTFKGVFSRIVQMNVLTQKVDLDMLAFTSDIQEVQVQVAVSYKLLPASAREMYTNVGPNYYNVLIAPRLPNFTKDVIKRYSAASLIENRDKLPGTVLDALQAEFAESGIEFVEVSVTDLDFSDAYTAAVEQKAVATQTALASAIEQKRLDDVQTAEAGRRRTAADAAFYEQQKQAEARAYEVEAAAGAEANAIALKAAAQAEGNRKLAESLTELLVDYEYKSRWNGQYPMYNFGGGAGVTPILPLPTAADPAQ